MTANEMLNKFSTKQNHANEVRRLGLMIFDEVNAKIKPMSEKMRDCLETACLLHDIGYSVEAKEHNKHSMNIILENGLIGFIERDTEIIACACRYHRGGLPKKDKHEVYLNFEKKDRKKVKKIAGILKIADGLSKTEVSLIKDIKLNYDVENNITEILLTPSMSDYAPDISVAVLKRDLFEIGFKTQSVIKIV